MSNIFNPFHMSRFQRLLVQLEEYDLKRYLFAVLRTFRKIPDKFRKDIVWTKKLTVISVLSYLSQIVLSYFLVLKLFPFFTFLPVILTGIVIFILLCYLHFIFIAFALTVIIPFDLLVKSFVVYKATKLLNSNPGIKVVVVLGSYGKTTMKEFVSSVLSQKYQVAATPSSVNTPVGISRFILNNVDKNTEVFIAELGEYHPGDISKLCRIVRPDTAVITGINEAHLERMGNIQNTIRTMFEVVPFLKDSGSLYLNADDENIKNNFQKITDLREIFWYNYEASDLTDYGIKNRKFNQENLVTSFDIYYKNRKVLPVRTRLAGDYVSGNAVCIYELGKNLGLTQEMIKRGIEAVAPVPHRLELKKNPQGDIIIIDDSYNGNPDGVVQAIKLLSKFKTRRKIFLTPGLAEMGYESGKVHIKIGEILASVCDMVILIKNSVTPYIAEGLEKSNFPGENIIWFENALAMQSGFARYVRPGDVLLFQNDWPDNYV